MRMGRVCVSPGFLLLCALTLAGLSLDAALGTAAAFLVHEGAHLAALYLGGGRLRALELTLAGAQIRTQGQLSCGRELLAVLAGPGSDLLLALVLARLGERWYLPAGICLAAGGFNLLPLPGLDGGRAVRLLILLLTEW